MNSRQLILGAFTFLLSACDSGNVSAADEAPVVYAVDSAHTRILWEAVTGSGVFLGMFNGAVGEIHFIEENPEKSSVHITITMDKLSTGVERLNTHLKSDEFFDAEQFPELVFESTAINVTGDKTALITGDLTAHGVTHPIVLDAMFRNHVDFGSSERIAFTATTVFKRSEYGVTHMADWIEDEVKLRIELEGGRDKSASNSETEPQNE